MARAYKVISADSHLEMASERWTHRIPAKYRDYAPRTVRLAEGGDATLVENRPLHVLGLGITGRPYEEHTLIGINYEGGPGAGPPEQRLKEQDRDGVDAEVLFDSPGMLQVWRGISDDNAYKAVIHAHNEFLAEEYAAVAPDRLLPMGIIPPSGLEDAVREVEYLKRAGLKGVALYGFPSGKGYPTPEDDRFWAAAIGLEMPLTVHVGFIGREVQTLQYKRKPNFHVAFGGGGDPVLALSRFAGAHALNAIQLMFAGVFDRFPKLKIYWAETQIGWLPYCYEQIDDAWRRSRFWMELFFGVGQLKRPPSEYIRDHCLWGFTNDSFGVRTRHEIGIDKIMWGNDFPHAAGDWPHSKSVIEKMAGGVPENERKKIFAQNAVEFFHLEDER